MGSLNNGCRMKEVSTGWLDLLRKYSLVSSEEGADSFNQICPRFLVLSMLLGGVWQLCCCGTWLI